jgi:hypothetical protein
LSFEPAIPDGFNFAICRFEKIIDLPAGQPVGGRKICKSVAIKTRDTRRRAKPQKTTRIVLDPGNPVLQQTVGDSIGLDRQKFGV